MNDKKNNEIGVKMDGKERLKTAAIAMKGNAQIAADLVAIEKEDVFELLHFWNEQVRNTAISREDFRVDLKDEVDYFQSDRGKLPWY